MNRNERANIAAEAGFPAPKRMNGQPAYADFGSIASIAGPIIGGMMQGDAAESAAGAQSQSSAAAIAEQRRQYDVNRSDLAPWRSAGGAAVTRLSQLLGLNTGNTEMANLGAMKLPDGRNAEQVAIEAANASLVPAGNVPITYYKDRDPELYKNTLMKFLPAGVTQESLSGTEQTPGFGDLTKRFTSADIDADPVYQRSLQFGLDEGRKGIENMARARGGLNSGSTLKALERYGTDYAGTKAADSYNRFVSDQTNLYNRLAGVAGTGQNAANTTVASGSNTANNIGGIMTAQGNARGAASLAQGNAYGGAFNTIGNYYNQQQMVNSLKNTVGNNYFSTSGTGGMYGEDWSN